MIPFFMHRVHPYGTATMVALLNSQEEDNNMSSTLIIATATSVKKADADYVCDGVADEVQINAALTALAALPNGGKLVFLEGLYSIAAPITIPTLAYGLYTLEGMGAGNTTIYAADNSNCDLIRTNITSGHSTFLIVRDLMIQGNRSNNATGGRGYYDGIGTGQCADTLFQNVFFYNVHGNCSEWKTCWGTKVIDCIFEDSDAKAIYFPAGTDVKAVGNKFIHILGNCIESNAIATEISKNIIFMAGTSSTGIKLSSSAKYSSVNYNQIHHDTEVSGCVGISVASDYGSIASNIIESETSGNIVTGIELTSTSSYFVGDGNVVKLLSGTECVNSGTDNAVQYNGNLKSSSGVVTRVSVVTTAYQALNTDDTIVANSGTPFNVTLPASPEIGQKVFVFCAGSAVVTLTCAGSHVVNGGATKDIQQLTGLTVQYVFTNNWIAS